MFKETPYVSFATILKQFNIPLLYYIQIIRWHAYLQLASSFLLLITVGIYTYFDKLLNFYSRIMRHFSISLFMAFMVLSLSQLLHKEIVKNPLCNVFGEICINTKKRITKHGIEITEYKNVVSKL